MYAIADFARVLGPPMNLAEVCPEYEARPVTVLFGAGRELAERARKAAEKASVDEVVT